MIAILMFGCILECNVWMIICFILIFGNNVNENRKNK